MYRTPASPGERALIELLEGRATITTEPTRSGKHSKLMLLGDHVKSCRAGYEDEAIDEYTSWARRFMTK